MQMKSVSTGRFFPSGIRGRVPRLLETMLTRWMGGVPGMVRIQLADMRLAWLMGRLFQHLHMRRRSPLTVVQREMVATVVNGLIDGAP
jgi:hypothetical protein